MLANRDFHILKGGMNNYHYSYLKDSNKWIFFTEYRNIDSCVVITRGLMKKWVYAFEISVL